MNDVAQALLDAFNMFALTICHRVEEIWPKVGFDGPGRGCTTQQERAEDFDEVALTNAVVGNGVGWNASVVCSSLQLTTLP